MRAFPGLRMDDAQAFRDSSTSDDAGNVIPTYDVVWTGRGTWSQKPGRLGAVEEADNAGRPHAAKLGSYFDVRAPGVTFLEGDHLTVLGKTWEVIGVEPIRTHTRLVLQFPVGAPFL